MAQHPRHRPVEDGSVSSPREVALSRAERPIPTPLGGSIHPAKLCGRQDHYDEVAAHGIVCTNYCLVCAVEQAAVLEEHGTWRIIQDHAYEMKEYAFEIAQIGRQEAEEIARIASTDPQLFRGRFLLEALQALHTYLDRAIKDLWEAHFRLRSMRDRPELRTPETIEDVTERIATALALLEEIAG